ncbi:MULTISPECIES: TetR family transcriptional regulator [unclassified Micromonospora]|uniref:TetR family transcriptional regulator n=1 Tax=unclassified Micromonospora TaxID=2617518 RepID=UPI0033B8AE35
MNIRVATEQAPRTSRRALAEEQRRRAILDAATSLFDERGFHGATTDDIAEAAGVTKRTLYRYMSSKEQILFEIHDRFLNRTVFEEVTGAGTAVERFEHMLRTHVNVVANHTQEIRVFMEERKHLPEDKKQEIYRGRDTYEAVLRDILTDGMESGVFVRGDVRLLAQGVLGALTEMYRWYRPRRNSRPDAIARVVSDLFLRGLLPPGADTAGEPASWVEGVPEVGSTADSDEPMARIMHAATELFSTRGYHGTATRELADAAGLTKGALFYHVGHKAEVLFAIQSAVVEEGIAMQGAVLDTPGSAAQTLARMVVGHFRILHNYHHSMAVVSEELKYLDPEPKAAVIARRDRYTAGIQELLRVAREAGELRVTDDRVDTLTILGMLNSTYRWYRPGGRLSADAIGVQLSDLLLHGLLAGEAR